MKHPYVPLAILAATVAGCATSQETYVRQPCDVRAEVTSNSISTLPIEQQRQFVTEGATIGLRVEEGARSGSYTLSMPPASTGSLSVADQRTMFTRFAQLREGDYLSATCTELRDLMQMNSSARIRPE